MSTVPSRERPLARAPASSAICQCDTASLDSAAKAMTSRGRETASSSRTWCCASGCPHLHGQRSVEVGASLRGDCPFCNDNPHGLRVARHVRGSEIQKGRFKLRLKHRGGVSSQILEVDCNWSLPVRYRLFVLQRRHGAMYRHRCMSDFVCTVYVPRSTCLCTRRQPRHRGGSEWLGNVGIWNFSNSGCGTGRQAIQTRAYLRRRL